MISHSLVHPEILSALASAGHGSRVLVADANYPFRTVIGPNARIVYLNLRPGLVGAVDVLETLTTAVAVESAAVMVPGEGPEPEVFADFRRLLPGIELEELTRAEFYAASRTEDLALLVATGEQRIYSNVLLTLGVVGV
jgi:L-fucose mutarotase